MRRSALLLTGVLALLASAGVLSTQGGAGPLARTPNCAFQTHAFFWTGSGWMRLAEILAANRSPCAEYWISIPPPAADKKGIRTREDDQVRKLGIHPVAELTIGGATGWANWVNEAGTNRTWFDAGVEFRRAMQREGYDVAAGETWLINEFDRTTARDAPREPPDQDWPPVRRADMRALMRGLYLGSAGMPRVAGIAEIGIHFRHQNIPDVARYRADMQGWLADPGFWNDADRYLRWIAVENYPDSRLWAPPGSGLDARARHLEAYVFHLLELVRSGPPATRVARSFFERKFLPLVNAGWRARGGEQFEFVTGHGNTILNDVQMRHFATEQVYAIRRYAGAHRNRAPAGRLGFSWQPCNRLTATEPDCRAQDAAFKRSLELITTRIAEAIRFAYGEGRSSAGRACAPPGGVTDWCRGTLRGASFTSAWDDFTWRPAITTRSIEAVEFSPDGRTLAAASNAGPDAPGIVRLWDVRTRREIGLLTGHEGAVYDIAFGTDGRTLATASADRTVRLWDIRSRRPIGEPLRGHTDTVWSVALNREGRTLASGGEDGTVRLWNARAREQRGKPIRVVYGYDVAFNRDGRALFSAGFAVQRWRTATHDALGKPLCLSRFGLTAIAVSRDGRMLACARAEPVRGPGFSLALWSVSTATQLGRTLRGHTDTVLSVAFSPDGRTLASGGALRDRTLRLWDTHTRRQIGAPFRGHTDAVTSVTFSPGGQTLASGSWDGTVRLWSARTHRQLGAPLRG